MKIHYTLDDSAARLPLTIRSADGVQDRVTDLRNAPGIHLVELTTQHMLNTGATLIDELVNYFDNDGPSESDPYALATCYTSREVLEDLLRDVLDPQIGLAAFDEVEALFPASFTDDLHFMLAFAAVGFPGFGYVRSYQDSEGEEYHGLVVNLAQAHTHLETELGQFSLSLLINVIRHAFFNHEGFLLAYDKYRVAANRVPEKPLARLKDALLGRGIAWYLSYRHNLPFYDNLLGLNDDHLASQAARWNDLITTVSNKRSFDDPLDGWLLGGESDEPRDNCIDVVGYYAARAIADAQGDEGLAVCIQRGPDYFIEEYNALGTHWLKAQKRHG